MLINILPPKDSLKNLIANILHKNSDGNSIADIRKELKTSYSRSATYQGINKILNSLKDEGIVLKLKTRWSLNKEWTASIIDVFNQYKSEEAIPAYTKEMGSVSFNTIGRALDFIIANIESDSLRNNGERIFIMHCKNIGFFALSKKQRNLIKAFAKNTECHILVEKNNLVNRLVGKFLKSLGCKVYLGIPRSTPHTITVYGNTIYNTFADSGLDSYLTNSYNTNNAANLKTIALFNNIKDDSRFRIKITFETDREIVEQTKKYLLNLAKGKQI